MNAYPCLKYEEAAKALLSKCSPTSSLSEIRYHYRAFAKKYTVIPRLFVNWIIAEFLHPGQNVLQQEKQCQKIKDFAKSHFSHAWFLLFSYENFKEGKFGRAFIWKNSNHLFSATQAPSEVEPFSHEILFQALIYPHNQLKNVKQFAKIYSTYPLPLEIKKKYKESLEIFSKIQSRANDEIFGLECIQKTQDTTLICENFEVSLGKFPCNKEIWQMYLKYLKNEKETQKLLNLYSRYCRLFIDDNDTVLEYRAEIESQNANGLNVAKWWIDTINYEKDFVSVEAGKALLENALLNFPKEMIIKYGFWFEQNYGDIEKYKEKHSAIIAQYPRLKNLHVYSEVYSNIKARIKFYHKKNFLVKDIPKTVSQRNTPPSLLQTFSLPSATIYYLQKFANSTTLLKLYFTAKILFFSKKLPLCYNLTILDGTQEFPIFYPHSLFLTVNNIHLLDTTHLIVTNTVIIYPKNNPNLFSSILPKMELKIKHLILNSQNITQKELEILSKLKLKTVTFDKVEILKDDKNFMFVEEIVMKFDNVKELSLLNAKFSHKTSAVLSQLQREIKLKKFGISKIPEDFTATHFTEFLKKNGTPDAKISVYFTEVIIEEQKVAFKEAVEEALPTIEIMTDVEH